MNPCSTSTPASLVPTCDIGSQPGMILTAPTPPFYLLIRSDRSQRNSFSKLFAMATHAQKLSRATTPG